jgi:hypothetical protein
MGALLVTPAQADLDLAESVEGWMAREELALLHGLARGTPRGQALVEVGNYRGRSTVALALGSRAGQSVPLYSVDPHLEFVGPRGGRFGPVDMAALYGNLTRTGVGEAVHVVCLRSTAVALAWDGPLVGGLFIDGDHRYGAVRADFEAWRPQLAPRAWVAFDDCDYPDVARLVGERVQAGQLTPQGSAGKVSWFRVP